MAIEVTATTVLYICSVLGISIFGWAMGVMRRQFRQFHGKRLTTAERIILLNRMVNLLAFCSFVLPLYGWLITWQPMYSDDATLVGAHYMLVAVLVVPLLIPLERLSARLLLWMLRPNLPQLTELFTDLSLAVRSRHQAALQRLH